MDADDISLPQRFEKQAAYLREHAECVCVGSRIELIDPYGSPVGRPEHQLAHEAIDAELLQGIGWAVVHPAAMMRRSAVDRIGGYRPQFQTSQDLDIFLRLAEVGRLANLPEVLLQYRRHFEAVSFHKHDVQWALKETIVGDAYRRRGLPLPEKWAFRRRVVLPAGDQCREWAWAALKRGNVGVARRHALHAVRRAPLSRESWRVAYCALRGH